MDDDQKSKIRKADKVYRMGAVDKGQRDLRIQEILGKAMTAEEIEAAIEAAKA